MVGSLAHLLCVRTLLPRNSFSRVNPSLGMAGRLQPLFPRTSARAFSDCLPLVFSPCCAVRGVGSPTMILISLHITAPRRRMEPLLLFRRGGSLCAPPFCSVSVASQHCAGFAMTLKGGVWMTHAFPAGCLHSTSYCAPSLLVGLAVIGASRKTGCILWPLYSHPDTW